jgi:endonuclease-3
MASAVKKQAERRKRALAMVRVLKRLFPRAGIALAYGSTWELVVAVVLSAQCTDSMVNRVTEKLFKKYRTLKEYASASPKAFERDIRQTGFYRNKTKNIIAAANLVQKRFHGRVPDTMEELLALPGVARKTANVILGNAFGRVEGIAVDTHVRRFAIRFDLSDHKDPVRIERDLMELLPRREWFRFTYRLIEYGRTVCPARRHDCKNHPLTKLYPEASNRWPKAR